MGRYVSPSVTCTSQPHYTVDFPPGCCLWTVPSGVSTVTFEIWGGGGGGGHKGCCVCFNSSSQIGGGGGGYSIKTISASPGDTYTLCTGCGGYAYMSGSLVTSCSGCKSFVTGNNLTNFCADGGTGVSCSSHMNCSGKIVAGGAAYGGDQNITGGFGYSWSGNQVTCLCCTHSAGGYSPFGGGESHNIHYACCVAWNGTDGLYPGGGGSSALDTCCCNYCYCGGFGGDGLIRVHY